MTERGHVQIHINNTSTSLYRIHLVQSNYQLAIYALELPLNLQVNCNIALVAGYGVNIYSVQHLKAFIYKDFYTI